MAKTIQMKDKNGPIYPCPYDVGDIYITTSSKHPNTKWGGTWELFGAGRTIVCVDASDTPLNAPKKTGGSVNPLTIHTHRNVIKTKALWGNPTTSNTWDQMARSPNNGSNEDKDNYSSNDNTGNNTNHANWQPFITCYVWLRLS